MLIQRQGPHPTWESTPRIKDLIRPLRGHLPQRGRLLEKVRTMGKRLSVRPKGGLRAQAQSAKPQDAPVTRGLFVPEGSIQGGADRRGAIFGIGSTSAIDSDDAPEVNGTEIHGGVYRTEPTSGMRTRRWDGICTDGACKCFMFFLTNCNG